MSSPLKAFQSLSPLTRLTLGISFLTWGAAGLYLSDKAEKRLGFESTEKDREALMPKVLVVERNSSSEG